MDYTELVKRLREPDKKCDDCSDKDNYDACLLCIDSLFKETADAIEKLQAINQRQLLEIAVLSKPRWIPVMEE